MTIPWLTVLWLIPAAGSVVALLLPPVAPGVGHTDRTWRRNEAVKRFGLVVSLFTAVWAVLVTVRFDAGGGRFQLVEDVSWIPAFGARYTLALDGVGLALILLTVGLTPILLLAGWHDADDDPGLSPRRGPDADSTGGLAPRRVGTYVALLLAIEAMVLISFVATDVLLFYIVFEAMLIPMYFLIGAYGPGTHGAGHAGAAARARFRSRAAVKFLLYNLFGGLIMLAAVIGLYVVSIRSGLGADGGGTFSLRELSEAAAAGELDASSTTLNLLFFGFLFAFAVKAPLWPLHTWLPDASVATTPSAAVMMMAVMDKVGTFAMLRFCVGLFPEASSTFAPLVSTLAVISILYGAILAAGQRDLMRLIAYTSVSHFGFIVLGIFALTSQGQSGSALYMVNHGVSTAALFLIAGFLVSQRGSRLIADYGGVQKLAPVLSGTFLVAGLATLSLPGLGPFVSEFLVLIGTFTRYPVAAIFAAGALVASAVYILWTYQRMMGGPPRLGPVPGGGDPGDMSGTGNMTGTGDGAAPQLRDLTVRQRVVVAPLIAALLALGLFPNLMLDYVNPAVEHSMHESGMTDPAPTAERHQPEAAAVSRTPTDQTPPNQSPAEQTPPDQRSADRTGGDR